MGALTQVLPGTTLTASILAAATSITGTNISATGLSWVDGNDIKITGAENIECAGAAINNSETLDGTLATASGNVMSGFGPSTSAYLAGAVLANVDGTPLVENTDYVMDYEGGRIRWINSPGSQGAADKTYAICHQYARADNTKIRLGKFLPTIEAEARLVHRFPDGRILTVQLHRASITPDTVSLGFDDADWIGTDMVLEALASNDPQHVNEPFGCITIEHKSDGTNSAGYDPDSYSVGVFELYLTMNDASVAAARGLPTTEIDVGNVSVGSLDADNTYLKHFRGTPKVTDKVVLTQKEMSITATIENLNTVNLALLFDGEHVADNSGAAFQDAATLMTVPSLVTLASANNDSTWYSLGAFNVNPA
mgnify:CR=1 FL=1